MGTLVLGGIRSGKSRWAEHTIADSLTPGQPVRYRVPALVAESDPAWAQEWAQRVAKHHERRPGHWSTVETDTQLRRSPDTATLVDELGSLNQRIAAVCDQVVLVGAGQAVPIKPART
ncbi:bifunctional adenosylcobinamide kinase/adenosylcobinamide-phosphate guanylyltransferase [Mycobacterium gastri]|uniref:Adenosylcobinamide kinase n=1 Tax=Mycobacterium gastri TaxID=1777 RepID=A0A1X1VC81_MYCGS|nr:bifunctional adenosylcobinamide kinase/adenosylcobinamide-phosphate guanylyltransferase [Mycobacterium gastri]ETW26303.1 hypothetical protein MGAST_28200 [Mycobacterium gastri 'Wayne']ORV66660.1 hypothetical protein AWC07_10865 [Mycobacterium gastri]